ncbi:hypothetical protein [Actinomadura atramentaria]|uniref:hypothetical protein n=1 Tax=Actinomadura atramentaria TaxID=1990 RepID=UPI000367C4AB|nr:hypothetical protein [Actinomadura atramentaria]
MPRTPVKAAAVAALAIGALAGCGSSPVKAGSAAIVGNDRITTASLDRDVRDWRAQFLDNQPANAAMAQSGASSDSVRKALNVRVLLRLADRTADRAGIDVTGGQLAMIRAQFAQRPGGVDAVTLSNGLPTRYTGDIVRYFAITNALATRLLPGGTTGNPQQAQAALRAAQKQIADTAASTRVEINPRYGTFDRATASIGPVTSQLSGTEQGIG